MKIALIAGASGVIGSACAKALAEKGYALALQYNEHAKRAQALLSALSPHTPVVLLSADISREKDVSELFRGIESHLGRIDLLVNCAGIALPQRTLSEVSAEEMDRIYEVNVKGAMLLTRAAIPHLLRKEGGAIVHVSSMWGIIGGSCEAVYSASKGALNAFVKAMAKELAPSHIRVNAIALGIIDTRMNSHLDEQEKAGIRDQIPAGYIASPEEAAQAMLRLLDMPEYFNGEIVRFDGCWI